jgi:small subunit ribosomal protein S8
MTDPIADMLTRIRNAQAVQAETCDIPFSKEKQEIAKVLERKGFVKKTEMRGRKGGKVLELALRYQDGRPAISGLKRVSKPGQRIYKGALQLFAVKKGYGIAIVATSRGIMTGKEAKSAKVGGEVLCYVW